MIEITDDYIIWPLKRGETLSNHDWWPFYGHSFLGSDFLGRAVMEGRRGDIGTALILWSEAMRQDPAGTLPQSDISLAMLARFSSVDDWRRVRENVLHGWVVVHVEDDRATEPVPRLGNPGLMMEIVMNMNKRRKGRDGARAAAAVSVRKSRIRKKMEDLKVAKSIRDNPDILQRLAEYFEHSDLYITHDNVRRAMADVIGYSGDVAQFPTRNKGSPGN